MSTMHFQMQIVLIYLKKNSTACVASNTPGPKITDAAGVLGGVQDQASLSTRQNNQTKLALLFPCFAKLASSCKLKKPKVPCISILVPIDRLWHTGSIS